MEKKRLSLLSRFMEVTVKGTKNKQLKEVESREWNGGGGRAEGQETAAFHPKFCPSVPTHVYDLSRIFFFLQKARNKKRKTWWEHKIESRIRFKNTPH